MLHSYFVGASLSLSLSLCMSVLLALMVVLIDAPTHSITTSSVFVCSRQNRKIPHAMRDESVPWHSLYSGRQFATKWKRQKSVL